MTEKGRCQKWILGLVVFHQHLGILRGGGGVFTPSLFFFFKDSKICGGAVGALWILGKVSELGVRAFHKIHNTAALLAQIRIPQSNESFVVGRGDIDLCDVISQQRNLICP